MNENKKYLRGLFRLSKLFIMSIAVNLKEVLITHFLNIIVCINVEMFINV